MTSLTLSSPISWSLFYSPPSSVPKPETIESNAISTSRDRNRRGKRSVKDEMGSYVDKPNTSDRRNTEKSRQNSPSEDLDVKESKPKQKGWNINMTSQEKLFLIYECCAYSDKYKPENKIDFWETIQKLLKEHIRYNLVDSRLTITC